MNFGKILRGILRPYLLLRDRYVESRLGDLSEERRFSLIYQSSYWKGIGEGSRSGEGSSLEATASIRSSLPKFLKQRNICSMLDVPCGDWFWMSKVDLGDTVYTGGDIVAAMIDENRRRYGGPTRNFANIDLIVDELPKADLVFVRDCFVHMEQGQIERCLENIIASGATYLATTTFADTTENSAPVLRDRWRPLNMLLPPFSFPEPVELLDDGTQEIPTDRHKQMGVWRVADLARLRSAPSR